jgi:hypothetical protein
MEKKEKKKAWKRKSWNPSAKMMEKCWRGKVKTEEYSQSVSQSVSQSSWAASGVRLKEPGVWWVQIDLQVDVVRDVNFRICGGQLDKSCAIRKFRDELRDLRLMLPCCAFWSNETTWSSTVVDHDFGYYISSLFIHAHVLTWYRL